MMVTSLLTLKVDVFFRMLFILSVKLLQNKMKVKALNVQSVTLYFGLLLFSISCCHIVAFVWEFGVDKRLLLCVLNRCSG